MNTYSKFFLTLQIVMSGKSYLIISIIGQQFLYVMCMWTYEILSNHYKLSMRQLSTKKVSDYD